MPARYHSQTVDVNTMSGAKHVDGRPHPVPYFAPFISQNGQLPVPVGSVFPGQNSLPGGDSKARLMGKASVSSSVNRNHRRGERSGAPQHAARVPRTLADFACGSMRPTVQSHFVDLRTTRLGSNTIVRAGGLVLTRRISRINPPARSPKSAAC